MVFWIIGGIVIYIVVLLMVLAICKSGKIADETDERYFGQLEWRNRKRMHD